MLGPSSRTRSPSIVVVVARLDRAALSALALALALSWDVTALHVDDGGGEAARLRERWSRTRDGIALEILAPGRDAVGAYLDRSHGTAPMVVVVPTVAPRRRWLYPLVNREAARLGARLRRRANTLVVSSVFPV